MGNHVQLILNRQKKKNLCWNLHDWCACVLKNGWFGLLALQRNTKSLDKYAYLQCFQSVASRFQCLTAGTENHPHLKIQGNRCFTVTVCPHIHFQSVCFLNFPRPKEENDWENQTDEQKCTFLNSILHFALLGIKPSPLRFVQVHLKWV